MKTKLLTLTIAVALGWFAFAPSGFAAFEILGDDICSVVSEYSCFEAEIERARRGELAQSNSTLVNPRKNLPPIKEKYSTQISLTTDTDGNAHVAAVALISDDGCDVRVNGTQWLKESGKGHDISKGLRRYGKLLLPGDENRFDIEYSQTFYDPAVLENDLDGLTMVVIPIPIDISVKDSSGKMNDRILVKKGETIEVAIHPVFWEHDLPGNDKIEWELGRLSGTGKVSWEKVGMKGSKISIQMEESGIFRLRATINGISFDYRRHQDVPHHRGVIGLQGGDYDYVGVYDYDIQKKLVDRAYLYCTQQSDKFLQDKPFDLSVYSSLNPIFPFQMKGAPKCNIFVYVVAYEEGVKIDMILRLPFMYRTPPLVEEWCNPLEKIRTSPYPRYWVHYYDRSFPEPGFIVCGSEHMGILDYDGRWISAGDINVVNKRACFPGVGEDFYPVEAFRERESN